MPAINTLIFTDQVTHFDTNLTLIFSKLSDVNSVLKTENDSLSLLTKLGNYFKNKEYGNSRAFLMKVDGVLSNIYQAIISREDKFDGYTQEIVSKYLYLVKLLCSDPQRWIFSDPSITLHPQHLQDIVFTVTNKSENITAKLIEQFYETLKISFDVKKFLLEYNINTLNIMNFAESAFSKGKEEIDSRRIITIFFHLLGYQGQLFFYYEKEFEINKLLLGKATQTVINNAVELQKYFFEHHKQKNVTLSLDLLKHFFSENFIKQGIYKHQPEYLANINQDKRLAGYFDSHYDPMPNRFSCHTSQNHKLEIRYNRLPEQAPQQVCTYIKSTADRYFTWLNSLNPAISKSAATLSGNCTYYLSENKDAFITNLYVHNIIPRLGDGLYQPFDKQGSTVYGLAFSYWSDGHEANFTAGHEMTHHYNHILYKVARNINKNLPEYLYPNINEGLASLFGGGACEQMYFYLANEAVSPPNLSYFLNQTHIGYPDSWLYNNYIVEEHKCFYDDFFISDQKTVINKWQAKIYSSENFNNWLNRLRSVCNTCISKNLVENDFHPISLQDYAQKCPPGDESNFPEVEKPAVLRPASASTVPQIQQPTEYYELMRALRANDPSTVNRGIQPICFNTSIINYVDPEMQGRTPLHYALAFNKNRYCSPLIIQQLIACGADPKIGDKSNHTAYHFSDLHCSNSQEIKTIFNDLHSRNTQVRISLLPPTKVANFPTQEKRPVLRPTRASNIPQIQQTKEYYDLMRALGSQDPSNVKKVIQPICLNTSMINYVNPGLGGQTPLHYALVFNKNGYCPPLIMQQLIDCGANPKIGDKSNQTAYDFAMQYCQNWLQIKTIFNALLLERSTTTRLPVVETTKRIDDNSSLLPVDVETTSEVTDIVPYRPRHYEYVVINVSTSVAKGSFTALSRYGFEKWQKHSSFAGRHPLLISVVKPIGDAVVISAMNLIYFSKKKGMIFNLSEMASGCIYFSVDLGLMFGTGLINNKVQALLKPRIERGSWLQKIPLNTGYFLFITAMFFLNNCSAIFGENAKGHELEVFLSVLANALLSSLVHHGVYNSINFLENYCGSVSQQENFDSEANPELESFICESVPCSNEHFISRQKTVDSKNIQSECSETSLMLGPDSSEIIPEEMLNIEILIDNLDKKIKSEKLKKSQSLFDQVDVLKLWAKNKYKEKSRFKEYKKNVKKLKITVSESSKECIEILREIYKNLSSQSIKKQSSDHKLQRIQYFVELLEQRLSFTDLSISEQETKINYLDNLKYTLRDKIESVQSLVSSTIEKINSGKNNSEAVIEFCKKLNNLERSLLDMELMAHVYGYYEYYSRADIRKILPYLNKGSDSDSGATDIENLYKDLEEKLDLVYSNLDNCKKYCEELTALDKKAYQEMIDTSQQSIADLLREIDQEKKKVVQSKRPKKWLDFGLFSPKQARNKAAVDKNRSVPLHCINPRC